MTDPQAISEAEIANRKSHIANQIAWQGWRLDVPLDWNPVKLEGTFENGLMLLADIGRPRLGVRWSTIRSRDPAPAIKSAFVREVGKLAAEETTPMATRAAQKLTRGAIYVEPEPPGRDVFVAVSEVSGRLVQLTAPLHDDTRFSRPLAKQIAPSLVDVSAEPMRPWSVFDLHVDVPCGFRLLNRRLLAGDLMLSFACGRERLQVRQIGPAALALSRQPADRWLDGHQRQWKNLYRMTGAIENAGASAWSRTLPRRRRLGFAWWVARQMHTVMRHDASRDRLVILDSTDPALIEPTLASLGRGSA